MLVETLGRADEDNVSDHELVPECVIDKESVSDKDTDWDSVKNTVADEVCDCDPLRKLLTLPENDNDVEAETVNV